MRGVRRHRGDQVLWPVARPVHLGEVLNLRWVVPEGTIAASCSARLVRYERPDPGAEIGVTEEIPLEVHDTPARFDDELEIRLAVPVDAVPSLEVAGVTLAWSLDLQRPPGHRTSLPVMIAPIIAATWLEDRT